MHELQLICDELDAENMKLPESFRVAAKIEKLPPTWKDFMNRLKHKMREMSLGDLHHKLKDWGRELWRRPEINGDIREG